MFVFAIQDIRYVNYMYPVHDTCTGSHLVCTCTRIQVHKSHCSEQFAANQNPTRDLYTLYVTPHVHDYISAYFYAVIFLIPIKTVAYREILSNLRVHSTHCMSRLLIWYMYITRNTSRQGAP